MKIYLGISRNLTITRQAQVPGQLPRKAHARETYTDKKKIEFTLEMTANTYSNYSTMQYASLYNLLKEPLKVHKWMQLW